MVIDHVLQQKGVVWLQIPSLTGWEVAVSAEEGEEGLGKQEGRSVLSVDLEYPESVNQEESFRRIELEVFLTLDLAL